MDDKDILRLKKLGFTEIESKIYLHLLKFPGENPTQIAKFLDISRSSSYNSIDNLEKQGIVKLLPAIDDRKNYKVINPIIFLELKRKELNDEIDNLKITLSSMYNEYNFEDIYNIDRIDNIRYIIIEILNNVENKIVTFGNINDEVIKNKLDYFIQEKGIEVLKFDSSEFILLVDDKDLVIIEEDNIMYTKNKMIINQINRRVKIEMEKK
ncbi:helix-turn-helix domain-containing protein [Pseudostreptobacillus hongkongensis]|uniref:TrmB family transcriptional regulator n=1 Tax=Pseudostreptobacillus hongkongensis TaxID=1162717 RepID=UPI0028D1A0E9|nr:helix-turn-helix domain-containing protein [Pseudostreptobacillus hongkongensis]